TPAARYLRGHALQELGRHGDARAAYESLIRAHGESPYALRAAIKLAWVGYLEGDAPGAREAAGHLLHREGLEPSDAGDAHYLMALIDAEGGALESALEGFDRVARDFAASAFALDAAYKRAETLARLGR